MIPQITISIFAIVGLIGWGWKGLVIGFIVGYLITLLIGLIPFSKLGLGAIKKKYRLAIAEDFYSQNKKEILSLGRFKRLEKREIINIFSGYINEICESSSKVKNPVKKYSGDMNVSGYRPNFVRGAKRWANKPKRLQERKLLKKFADFCEKAIYEDFKK